MGHDQLFKAVLQAFFRDFLQLFYPKVAKHLDFKRLRFLDKELFPDFPKGPSRAVDVVVRARTRHGEPRIVLVHIEIEAVWRQAFRKRMFDYYVALWQHYHVPIVPIVLYLRGGREGLITEEYRMAVFGEEHLRFRYHSVRLAKLHAGEYLRKGTPLGAALAALMDRRKAGEPLSLRARMMKKVVQSGRKKDHKRLLLDVIGTYFMLRPEQKESFSKLLSRKEYWEAREMELTWSEEIAEEARAKGRAEGREEGREEGRQVGLLTGKREVLLRQLTRKFGSLPERAVSRLRAMESLDELDACLDRILTAQSLEEMGF